MNKLITLLALTMFSAMQLSAQTIEIDINDKKESAYLKLSNLEITNVDNRNWDIAFMNGFIDGAVRINGANGVRLWHVNDGSIDDYDMVLDTSGKFEIWSELLNSTEKWSLGAFNLESDGYESGTGDYGWGQYAQGVGIIGSEMYVIKLRNGEYKKITLNEMVTGTYYFSYSDLNNENKMEGELTKSNFSGKLLSYYDLAEGKSLDREPSINEWDLEFTRYVNLEAFQGGFLPYPVSGVRSNRNIKVAQLDDVDVIDTPLPKEEEFSTSLTAIGSDWKTFNNATFVYELKEDRVYFVQRFETVDNGNGPEEMPVGELHKLVFTGFEGSKFTINGQISSVSHSNYDNSKFAVYPNVISKNETVNLVYAGGEFGQANLNIYSSTGANVYSQNVTLSQNLQISNINTADFNSGVYFVRIQKGNSIYTQKFVVR
ncbi:MAG: T9SS type A sorting domain-containing protein [Candidatus Kapaibacterium sp.]|nr:T9SS type A sorting domain-containing protein [Ignavibacteriota bacterium]